MQSSSRISRRGNGDQDSVLPNTEVEKGKQETVRKASLTDQGKAAKLLRQRLALALATNTKLKSDSSNSESDQETTGKDLKARGERKTSIPRKNSQGTTKKPPHALQATDGGNTGDKSQNSTTNISLRSGIENTTQVKNSRANLPFASQKESVRIQSGSFSSADNKVTKNKTDARQSQVPPGHDDSLPTIHEKATTNSEDGNSPSHYNLDAIYVIESELIKLKADVNKTMVDFQGINASAELVKKKLEELRSSRIGFAN